MRMHMAAARNVFDRSSNRAAIFHDWFVLAQIAQGDLVTERHIFEKFDFSSGFSLERDRADRRSFVEIGNSNADVIVRLVQQNAVFHIYVCSIRSVCGPSQRALRHSRAKLSQSYFQSPGILAKRAQWVGTPSCRRRTTPRP